MNLEMAMYINSLPIGLKFGIYSLMFVITVILFILDRKTDK